MLLKFTKYHPFTNEAIFASPFKAKMKYCRKQVLGNTKTTTAGGTYNPNNTGTKVSDEAILKQNSWFS